VVRWLPELAHATGAAAAMAVPVYLLAGWGVADSPIGLWSWWRWGGCLLLVAFATRRQIYSRAKRIASSVAVR